MKVYFHEIIKNDNGDYITLSREIERPITLEAQQKMVEGYIEHVNYHGWLLVVNEEGKLLNLPINQWALSQGIILRGNVIQFCRKRRGKIK